MKIKIINGPNLNMLGRRNKTIYGNNSYEDLTILIEDFCKKHDIEVSIFQSNYEGQIIDVIHSMLDDNYDGLIINPGAFTHYSYAIRDAIEILTCLKVEVHLSDIYHREDFRKTNVIVDIMDYSVVGMGINGYIEAIKYIINNRQNGNFPI